MDQGLEGNLKSEMEALRRRMQELVQAESEHHRLELAERQRLEVEHLRRLALERVHRVILEMEKVEDFAQVVGVIAAELRQLGISFDALGLNIIDETEGTLTSYAVFADNLTIQAVNSLDHPANRELLDYWRRGQVWERTPDEAFRDVSRNYEVQDYAPGVVIDAPFSQGTLVVGMAGRVGENAELVAILVEFCSLISLGYTRSRDLAERRLAEEALRQAHARLEERVQERTAELAAANQSLRQEVGERQRAEDRLKASLAEKETLLKEIHHRVKNNLQVVCSLLDLQTRHVADPQVLDMFRDSHHRVRSMALVHEKLYQSRDLAQIELAGYIRALAGDLLTSYDQAEGRIELAVDVEEVGLNIDAAIPCGLILNELVTNALKHAFPDGRRGRVRIGLHRCGRSHLVLSVADDGVGIATELLPGKGDSLGLKLVASLALQLRGKAEWKSDKGTECSIAFPLPGTS